MNADMGDNGKAPAAPGCVVCRDSAVAPAYRMPDYNVFRCAECGLHYVDVPYEEKEIQEMDYYWGETMFAKEAASFRKFAAAEMTHLEKYRKGGELLDLGCSFGFLLEEARSRGWNVSGVEISRKVVEKYLGPRAAELRVFNGRLEDAAFADGRFDTVTMFDVIEHLADPTATLTEVARILKPGGLFVVETPREESLYKLVLQAMYTLSGGKWNAMVRNAYNPHPGGHRFGFTEKSMDILLRRVGFRPLKFEKRMILYKPYMSEIKRTQKKTLRRWFFVAAGFILWTVSWALRMENRMIVYAEKTGPDAG